MALYNKMRPQTLKEVKGQKKIIDIIKNNIQSGNLPNAMLFVGTRGVGKTTIAKIVARMLNCEHSLADGSSCDECPSCKAILSGTSLDVIELDAASNNGVDNIREIIENLQYKPIGKMKAIIFDEVHMLSKGGFNALLKSMEEPPKNVLFILCTTELHNVPATIISRCRKFEFESISVDIIVEKLKEINHFLQIEAEEEALYVIAKAAKGSMRDAESIYESFLDNNDMITAALVRETLGFTAEENVFAILDAIVSANPVMATSVIEDVFEKGGSLNFLLEECMHTLMDIISIKMSGDITDKGNSAEYLAKITDYAFNIETQRLFEISDAFCKTYGSKSSDKLLSFQAMLIELACTQSTITALLNRVAQLEETVAKLQASNVIINAVAQEPLQETVCASANENGVSTANQDEESDPVQDNSSIYSESDSNANENNVSTNMSTNDSNDELRALGLTVVDDLPDFEEETLDDSMLETPSDAYDKHIEEEKVKSSQQENKSSAEASNFFDDFARLFWED